MYAFSGKFNVCSKRILLSWIKICCDFTLQTQIFNQKYRSWLRFYSEFLRKKNCGWGLWDQYWLNWSAKRKTLTTRRDLRWPGFETAESFRRNWPRPVEHFVFCCPWLWLLILYLSHLFQSNSSSPCQRCTISPRQRRRYGNQRDQSECRLFLL